jgi:MarR family multiple antibiotic resistance transcriptional regulator
MSEDEGRSLEMQLASMIGRLAHRMRRAMDQGLGCDDLTIAQFVFLRRLEQNEIGTPSEAARRADIDSGAMTRLLDRLENKGLIQRRASQNDRRSVRLEITDLGREKVKALGPVVEDLSRQLCKSLSRGEQEDLIALLAKLLAAGAAAR